MRKRYVVFHDNKRIADADEGWLASQFPTGSYVYDIGLDFCYLVRWGNAEPINNGDVPNIVRAYKLLFS